MCVWESGKGKDLCAALRFGCREVEVRFRSLDGCRVDGSDRWMLADPWEAL
jgi:hypothetical protein